MGALPREPLARAVSVLPVAGTAEVVAAGVADGVGAEGFSWATGCTKGKLGEFVMLALACVDGNGETPILGVEGGGNGEIPRLFLSLAAAAAAALAYLRPSPAGLGGIGAGFMVVEGPLPMVGREDV